MNLTIRPSNAVPLQQAPKLAASPLIPSPASPLQALDQTSIHSGIIPTLKGASLGLVAGGSSVLLASRWLGLAGGDGMTQTIGFMAGAAVGSLAGGITANTSDNPWKAPLIAAAAGAVAGAVPVLLMGGREFALFYGGIGALSGAAGGLSGAIAAQRQPSP